MKSNIPIEGESFWKKHFEQFKLTNLSKAEYARRNNLVKHRFIYWAYKFEKIAKKAPIAASEFIPVTIKQTPLISDKSEPVLCTLQLSDGKKLLLHSEAAVKLCLDAWK